jgi:hypothetical protein
LKPGFPDSADRLRQAERAREAAERAAAAAAAAAEAAEAERARAAARREREKEQIARRAEVLRTLALLISHRHSEWHIEHKSVMRRGFAKGLCR